jgi:tetratricopeptide (TPR) repeat protein
VAAEEEVGRSLKPSQVSNFYYRKGLDFFVSRPGQAFKLLTKKLYLFWSRLEISNNQDIYFYRRYSSLIRILPLGFWFIGPLGLIGMVLSLLFRSGGKKTRSRNMLEKRKEAWLPVLFVFSYMITVVMFFVPARFRLPAVPFLIIFSSFALVWISRRVLKKDFHSAMVFLALLIPCLLLTDTNAYHLGASGVTTAQAHFALGNVYLKDGQLDAALAQFDTVLALDPAAAQAHLNRGLVLFRKGDYQQAEQEYLTELRLYPDEDKAYNNLAALYIEQGRHAEGQEMAKKAVAIRKYAPYGYVNLATSYWRTGRDQEAKQVLSEGFSRVTPFLEGNLLLGEILQSEGKIDSAMEQFGMVVNPTGSLRDVNYDLETLAAKGGPLNPEESRLRAKAHFEMATMLIHEGELDQAETHLRQALSLQPDMAEAYANLGILYDHTGRGAEAVSVLQKAISINPRNAVFHYNLGLVYAKQKQLQSARDEFQRSLDLKPSQSDAHQRLLWADSLLQNQGGSH